MAAHRTLGFRGRGKGGASDLMPTTQVVWFKRDLRLHDHAVLSTAAARGPVLALYVIEPELWNQPSASMRHWQVIQAALFD